MIHFGTRILTAAALAILAAGFVSKRAAADPAYHLGDPAPALSVMSWIKGRPVPRFETGHVYVVEFWATWCGPCHATMPRLSALQAEHPDGLTIIGVNAREAEELAGAQDSVAAFVKSQGDRMAYTVAMDNPVTHPVFDMWMSFGGTYGIPTAFVVDGAGKVIWVGNPVGPAGEHALHDAVERSLALTRNGGAPHKSTRAAPARTIR